MEHVNIYFSQIICFSPLHLLVLWQAVLCQRNKHHLCVYNRYLSVKPIKNIVSHEQTHLCRTEIKILQQSSLIVKQMGSVAWELGCYLFCAILFCFAPVCVCV